MLRSHWNTHVVQSEVEVEVELEVSGGLFVSGMSSNMSRTAPCLEKQAGIVLSGLMSPLEYVGRKQ